MWWVDDEEHAGHTGHQVLNQAVRDGLIDRNRCMLSAGNGGCCGRRTNPTLPGPRIAGLAALETLAGAGRRMDMDPYT